jgi:hypothetical protein
MMVNEKIRSLIDRLLSKTSTGEINWEEADRQEAFQISFPNYSVVIEKDRDGELWLRMYDFMGRVLDTVSSDELHAFQVPGGAPGGTYADRLLELHGLARRQALRVEKALDELLARLA